MRLSFDSPIWLLGLLAVPLVIWLGRRGVSRVRRRQHRVATWARAVAVALLVAAIAGPRWQAAGRAVDVVFLVDGSDSVGGGGRAEALEYVTEALGHAGPADRAALAFFGRDARLEYTLRGDPPRDPPATVIDGSASDLARALRLGQGVLGSEHRRRAILLTDGRETQGDAARAAAELAEAGVHVDVVSVAGGRSADVLIEEVEAPSRVRQGETFDVRAVLRNTGTDPVDVVAVVTADGEEVHRETINAAPGRSEFSVEQTADEGGTVRYEVRLASGASTVAQNDLGRAAVQVDGPPKVLVYEGEAGLGAELARALRSAGVPTDVRNAEADAFPPLDALLEYDSVILVDIPITALGDAGVITLDQFVRDAGRGLVAVGGDESFGMGGYDGTPLEDLLPVFARVQDPKRRPSVAEALVVDVSGSMAACHCNTGGFGGGQFNEGSGVNKTEITREAVARAVTALQDQDTIGVLAFNTTSEWVIPLQKLPSQAVVDEGLAKLHPLGGTSVPQAVREAIAGLRDVDARLRHIVLFTDGWTEDQALVDVAAEAAAEGITLSVVATGEGTGEVLRRMAAAGGGRFYPGRDLFSIPDIIVSELQFAARPIINEGAFLPVVTAIAPPTEDLTSSPALFGYLATTAKPTSTTLLAIGEERDPLLATWTAGLGTAVAWTSDTSPRWSADWVTWERFSEFWADVVKGTFPGEPDARYQLSATATTDGLRITVDTAGVPSDVEAVATVTFPDGTRVEVPLDRTSVSTFEATLPAGAEGVYAVSVRLSQGDVDLFRDAVTAIRSYSPEYAVGDADTELLARVADAGRGRLDPAAADAFLATDLEPGSSSRPLWPWLALVGLVLLPTDVGLRRLLLERGDWARVRAWMRRKTIGRRGEVAERRETTEGLLGARERARTRLGTSEPPPDAPPDVPPTAPTAPTAPTPPTPPAPTAAPPTAPADETPGGIAGLRAARDRAREPKDEPPA